MKLPLQPHLSTMKKYFELPNRPSPNFLGRDDVLNEIHRYFTDAALATQQRLLSIYGIGGSGKTEVALTYAFKHRDDYDAIFLIDTTNVISTRLGFERIHRLLRLSNDDLDETFVRTSLKLPSTGSQWRTIHVGCSSWTMLMA
jgi:hypothetical protein